MDGPIEGNGSDVLDGETHQWDDKLIEMKTLLASLDFVIARQPSLSENKEVRRAVQNVKLGLDVLRRKLVDLEVVLAKHEGDDADQREGLDEDSDEEEASGDASYETAVAAFDGGAFS